MKKVSRVLIDELKTMSHYGNHNFSRLRIAQEVKNNSHKYIKFYKAMDDLRIVYGYMPKNVLILRDEMEFEFMNFLKSNIENFEEIYNVLYTKKIIAIDNRYNNLK